VRARELRSQLRDVHGEGEIGDQPEADADGEDELETAYAEPPSTRIIVVVCATTGKRSMAASA
jgi:hypothetical protein